MMSLPSVWVKYTMYAHPRAKICAKITPLPIALTSLKNIQLHQNEKLKTKKKKKKRERNPLLLYNSEEMYQNP